MNLHYCNKRVHNVLFYQTFDSVCIPFNINNEQFTLGVSIGIAIAPQDGENFEELFKNADTAMYVAKSSGKNRYAFYTPSMTDEILSTTLLDKEINQYKPDNGYPYCPWA